MMCDKVLLFDRYLYNRLKVILFDVVLCKNILLRTLINLIKINNIQKNHSETSIQNYNSVDEYLRLHNTLQCSFYLIN